MNYVFVGTGRMGKTHMLAAHSLGLTVAGVCDRSDVRMEAIANEFSLTKGQCFKQPESMFASVRAPLVLIATTADCHAELVALAAKHSRYILCEKPMATSLKDAQNMIATCDANNTHLAINHQMRFMDQYTLIKDELAGDHLGRLGSMTVVTGNIGLAMNGSHYFEAFRYLTDSRIKSVSAVFSSSELANPRGEQFRDAAGALMCLAESGQHFLLSAGERQGHGMTVTYATQWGSIFCDELGGKYVVTARQSEHRDLPSTRYGMPSERYEKMFPPASNVGITAAVMKALLDEINYPNGQDGRHAIACLVAAYKSAETGGRAARLDDLSDYESKVFPWA